MKFINLTNQNISIIDKNENLIIFEKSGIVASITSVKSPNFELDGFWVKGSSNGTIIDMPTPQKDTIYIVSGMVLSELNGARKDVVAPNTHTAKRDEHGKILYVKEFIGVK